MDAVREIRKRLEQAVTKDEARKLIEEYVAKRKAVPRRTEFAVPQKGGGEWQDRADNVYLLKCLLRASDDYIRNTEIYKEFRKQMDTETSGEGAEWVPTEFSPRFRELMTLDLKVASLIPQINMPSDPYRIPVQTSDPNAYLVGESTTESGTKPSVSNLGTAYTTLDAVKIGARVMLSDELTEDSVVPVLDVIKRRIRHAIAAGLETALLNGDDSGTHMDSDVTSADDVRKAFKGFRKLATGAGLTVDLGTFNLSALISMIKTMKKYGIDYRQLVWVTGAAGYAKLLSLNEVITVDKYGAKATVLAGELAKLLGIPVVVSEYVREDLNATGVYDGVTTDKTVIYLIRRDEFVLGWRRNPRIRVDTNIATEQTTIVASQRVAFTPYQTVSTDYPVVVLGVNVAT